MRLSFLFSTILEMNAFRLGRLADILHSRRAAVFFFILCITAIFIASVFHESYPDEFDNILGGRYILEGRMPFSGFFTHHGPVAYFIAAFIELFSGTSFVRFRFLYGIFLSFLSISTWGYLWWRLREKVSDYPVIMAIIAFATTFVWLQMILADGLSAFFLLPVYILIFTLWYYKKTLRLVDLVFINALSFLSLFSSLTYMYFVIVIYLATIYVWFQGHRYRFNRKTLLVPLVILACPFVLLLGYFTATGSLDDYVAQNIQFNRKYYIYNYPRPEGSDSLNPARFAVVIAHDYFNNTIGLLNLVKDFNVAYPFATAMGVANAAIIIVLLLRRRYAMAAFVLATLIYANVRSNPLTTGERDYQSAVYIVLSIANAVLFFRMVHEALDEAGNLSKKIIYGFLLILTGFYSVFWAFHIFGNFVNRYYGKYMGTIPLIYDRPVLAPIINDVTEKDDYVWIGPFEFEELWYMEGRLPSKYHILIPGLGKSKENHDIMMADFRKNKPKVIIFDKRYFIFGNSPEMYAKFFIDFLDKEYVTLFDYRRNGLQYVSVAAITERVDIETKLYIDKDKVEEVVDELLQKNYIKLKTP